VYTYINPFSPGAQCNICHTFVQWSVTCDMSQWSVTVICHMNHRAYFCMTSVEPTHFDHVPILVLGLPGKPVCHSCVTTCIPQANQCASLVLLHVYPRQTSVPPLCYYMYTPILSQTIKHVLELCALELRDKVAAEVI